MELRQLQSFVALAEELHFGQAAARLYMATSTLSEQIQALERDLGVPLLCRSSRRVALTAAGRDFLIEAKRVLADVEAARSAAVRAPRAGQRRLRLGWPAAANPAWAEPIYAGYRALHPEIAIELTVDHSGPHAAAVATGRLDVAFVTEPQDVPVPLTFRALRRGWLNVACAATHPLARTPAVTLRQLRAAVHVAFPRESNPPLYRRVYDQLLEGSSHLVEHATSLQAVLGIVAAGEAVALRPEDSLPAVTCQPVVCRPVALAGFEVAFGLTWRAEAPSSLVESFVRYASTVARLSDYPDCPELPNEHSEATG
jgi:DNA-binding transcriptional LysR family regulator